MVDIVVAAPVFCRKMLVDHGVIIQRGNILIAAFVLLIYVWHILTNANDLTCSDRRVRPAGHMEAANRMAGVDRSSVCVKRSDKRQANETDGCWVPVLTASVETAAQLQAVLETKVSLIPVNSLAVPFYSLASAYCILPIAYCLLHIA